MYVPFGGDKATRGSLVTFSDNNQRLCMQIRNTLNRANNNYNLMAHGSSSDTVVCPIMILKVKLHISFTLVFPKSLYIIIRSFV